jgi:hypothetical protein
MKFVARFFAIALGTAAAAAPAQAGDANYILPISNLSGYDVQVQIMPVGSASSCVAFNADYSAVRTLHPGEVFPLGFWRSGDCHGRDGFIGIRVAGQHMPYQSLSGDDLQWVEFDADGGLSRNGNMPSAYANAVQGSGRVMGDTAVYEFQILPSKPIVAPPVSNEVLSAYAPLVYLHPDEDFMPSSIEYFAANTHMECFGNRLAKSIMSIGTADMPSGQGTTNGNSRDAACRTTTNDPMNGPYDIKPFFHGVKPTAEAPVPVYVFIYDWQSPTTFTAQFNTFYPWNKGKMACPMFAPNDNCVGQRYEADDHVGDWELATVRFVDGKPVAVHVGAHGNDEPEMASTYRAPNWGALQWSGTHPIVYSAAGSHGTWATEGAHNYKTLPTGDKLVDHTGRGVGWETWRAMVMASDPKYNYLLTRYRGDWGNFHQGKDPCDMSPVGVDALCRKMGIPVSEDYQLNDGPSMPDRDRDRRYVGVPAGPLAAGSTDLELNGRQDGTGSYARAPDSPDLRLTTQLTLEASVYWDGTPGYRVLVSKPRNDAPGEGLGTGYALVIADGKPVLAVAAGSENRVVGSAPLPIPAKTWVTVSATYDGKQTIIYVNGGEVARQQWSTSSALDATPTSLLIGREFMNGLTERSFGGRLSDVRVWNQVLAPEAIAVWSGQASVAGHPNQAALTARWLLNDAQGTTARDASGHSHDASLANNAAWHKE